MNVEKSLVKTVKKTVKERQTAMSYLFSDFHWYVGNTRKSGLCLVHKNHIVELKDF